MKGISFVFALFAASVILAGCSIGSGGAKVARFTGFKADSTAASVSYADGWDAMRRFDFTYAQKSGWTKAHPHFAEGMNFVMNGKYDEAEKAFSRILSASRDSVETRHAKDALNEALAFQSKWNAIVEMDRRHPGGADGDNAAALARAYRAAMPETLSFPDGPVELPAKFGLSGTPEIEVTVNGVRKRFIIDTGAGLTVLASDFAEACGVKPAGAETAKAGTATDAKVSIRPAVIREISIGGLAFKNHPCIIIDKKDLEIKLFGFIKLLKVDGIIGWNAIQQIDLTLDYRNKKVRMEKPVPSAAGPERNLFWLGYPVVKAATASGRPLFFGLDTGANQSSASDPVLSKIDTSGMKTKKVRIGGAGGKIETRMTLEIQKMPVVIGDNQLTFEGIRCDKAECGSFFLLDGILGSDAAKNGVMRIDFANGRFDLTFPGK
jgi:hypothetical protein